jgi:hypothetical protein
MLARKSGKARGAEQHRLQNARQEIEAGARQRNEPGRSGPTSRRIHLDLTDQGDDPRARRRELQALGDWAGALLNQKVLTALGGRDEARAEVYYKLGLVRNQNQGARPNGRSTTSRRPSRSNIPPAPLRQLDAS